MPTPNDWSIRRFLTMVLALQIAVLAAIGLSLQDYGILVVGVIIGVIGFIYLTFIPGFLCLRILRLHNLSPVEALVYAVGLSLALLMFIGLVINWLYPLVGFHQPLSLFSLLVTTSFIVLLMAGLSYWIDRDFAPTPRRSVSGLPLMPVLLLITLPFLSLVGAFQFNSQQDNTLFMVMFPLIAAIPILIASGKLIPQRLFAVAIFIIAISLLLHRTLITENLVGWDVRVEYLVYRVTEQKALWSSIVGDTPYASSLAVTLLPTFYHRFLGISGVWYFKVVYPLFFSLTAVALYAVYRQYVDPRRAFLASFFFVAFPAFYITGTEIGKQGMAMLFVALLILAMTNTRMPSAMAVLTLVFCFSIAVTHYGVAYLWIICLVLSFLLQPLLFRLQPSWEQVNIRGSGISLPQKRLSGTVVIFFLVVALTWYMFTSEGQVYASVARWGKFIVESLGEFLTPASTDVGVLKQLGMASVKVPSLWYSMASNLSRLTRVIIVVGGIGVAMKLVRLRQTEFSTIYLTLSTAAFLSLGLAFIPFFTTGGFRSDRLYLLSLILLSPFFILGISFIFQLLRRWLTQKAATCMTTITLLIILLPYFLLQSGWVFQVAGDVPSSFALSSEVDFARFDNQEEAAARWLCGLGSSQSKVYADVIGVVVFLSYPEGPEPMMLGGRSFAETEAESRDFSREAEVPKGDYLYLRGYNVEQREVALLPPIPLGENIRVNITEAGLLDGKAKIYANGRAHIYK